MSTTYIPVSSYRIQFNRSFGFKYLESHLDYLSLLGADCIYASPIFTAVTGSDHGYDVINPNQINPELGGINQFESLTTKLQRRGMGWIQDIVPNHMAYHRENQWMMDVLEKGPESNYATFFDLEPNVAKGKEKLMLPFLGEPTEQALSKGELEIRWNNGNFALGYYEHFFPVNFPAFRDILKPYLEQASPEWREIWSRHRLGRSKIGGDFLDGDWEEAKKQFDQLYRRNEQVSNFIRQILGEINNNRDFLAQLISGQHYEPCYWRETAKRINYRRFFTVASLICLRTEDQHVMESYHQLITVLAAENWIQGLRVDHVDGLRNPGSYLRRLRSLISEEKYLTVEKILEKNEQLPSSWPVQGSTGYDFLALINNLLTASQNHPRMQRLYRRLTDNRECPEELIYRNKRKILFEHMRGELDNLYRRFKSLLAGSEKNRLVKSSELKEISREDMHSAIAEFMLACPVYRLYPEHFPLPAGNRAEVIDIFKVALSRNPQLKQHLLLLKKILLVKKISDPEFRLQLEEFFSRCMQYTGPLTAKGVEDTSLYQYYCLPAHNEVGDSIIDPGITSEEFHQAMRERMRHWPMSMNCTSTHDTKRGEDVRARLHGVTEMADKWEIHVKEWFKINQEKRRKDREGKVMPAPNDEYLIYQTLTGTFPYDEAFDGTYIKRIQDYMIKALREGRRNSQWEDPALSYEQAVRDFIAAILQPGHSFLKSFIRFHRKLAWKGIHNSLVQLTIKCLAPGVPDIYQGSELWDLNLVDPDNRGPVDLGDRHNRLRQLSSKWREKPIETVCELFENARDGNIKLWLTHLLLRTRKEHPALFKYGEYLPLFFEGKLKDHLFGFLRRHENLWLMCVLPLRTGMLSTASDERKISPETWQDTHLTLPAEAPEQWHDLLAEDQIEIEHKIDVATLLSNLPIAVLKGENKTSNRRAGVLLHITSLPGRYGIGDLGEEAYRFADFLNHTRQSYWQTLPLTPVDKATQWSPYSSPSAFAGNPLLISPQYLYRQGLLEADDLAKIDQNESDQVDFTEAEQTRHMLLQQSWHNMTAKKYWLLEENFTTFCREEADWLEDYCLFIACKKAYNGKTWNQWPAPIRNRDTEALRKIGKLQADTVEFEKYCQFMFDRQWRALKQYANNKGISMVGDMPFYVSYDSADVWAHQKLFKLRKDKQMQKLAGVPPDYFDAGGQLWNMPVFNWRGNRDRLYQWWLRRITRNLALFDLLRLDHFRAFSAFWEVPENHKTAVAGQWSQGPGSDFFSFLNSRLPALPLIAEDLGEIDQPVYDLRDQFGLPGMQVLQFSFDRKMARNLHTPHNHRHNSVVYTGTHDNNTVRGWFDRQLDAEGKKRLRRYIGAKITASNIHWHMIRMALASPAKLAIIPLQDYLGLGEEARMNTPSTATGNWRWKLTGKSFNPELTEKIAELTLIFNRK